jgi:hypothetical protein
VFHTRLRLEKNKPILVIATDNDPCFSGIAYATLISKEDMRKTKTCDRHKYEYAVRVSYTCLYGPPARIVEGNAESAVLLELCQLF